MDSEQLPDIVNIASKLPAIVTALGQGKIFAAEEGSLKYTM